MTIEHQNNQPQNDDKRFTKDGTPLPPGHFRGDGHDHDGDGKPSVSQE